MRIGRPAPGSALALPPRSGGWRLPNRTPPVGRQQQRGAASAHYRFDDPRQYEARDRAIGNVRLPTADKLEVCAMPAMPDSLLLASRTRFSPHAGNRESDRGDLVAHERRLSAPYAQPGFVRRSQARRPRAASAPAARPVRTAVAGSLPAAQSASASKRSGLSLSRRSSHQCPYPRRCWNGRAPAVSAPTPDCWIDPAVRTSMNLDAGAAWVAVLLGEAKQQRHARRRDACSDPPGRP